MICHWAQSIQHTLQTNNQHTSGAPPQTPTGKPTVLPPDPLQLNLRGPSSKGRGRLFAADRTRGGGNTDVCPGWQKPSHRHWSPQITQDPKRNFEEWLDWNFFLDAFLTQNYYNWPHQSSETRTLFWQDIFSTPWTPTFVGNISHVLGGDSLKQWNSSDDATSHLRLT